jgi:hypothetical protein
MMEYFAPDRANVDRTLQGRRVLDAAEGILVGLRRCDLDTAFLELVRTAKQYKIPVFTMAAALIELATGGRRPDAVGAAAESAAQREWGRLLGVPGHDAGPGWAATHEHGVGVG